MDLKMRGWCVMFAGRGGTRGKYILMGSKRRQNNHCRGNAAAAVTARPWGLQQHSACLRGARCSCAKKALTPGLKLLENKTELQYIIGQTEASRGQRSPRKIAVAMIDAPRMQAT